jgi:TonB family protein
MGAALAPRRPPVTALVVSVMGHALLGAILIGLLVWRGWDTSRVHVVNLVPSVAVVGSPKGQAAAPPVSVQAPPPPPAPAAPPPPKPSPPAEPRAAEPPPRTAPEPVRPRPPQTPPLPERVAHKRELPSRPQAIPRPGERELPRVTADNRALPAPPSPPVQSQSPPSESQPAPPPPPRPVTPPVAEARPAPPAPLGQPTGSVTGSGALTLDVSDFPHAWYLRQVLRKVEEQWQKQGLTQEPNQKPLVIVEIQRNGTIEMPRVEKTSGSAFYDQAALRAIMDASPFPELPKDWTRPVLRVMFRFEVQRG